MSPHRELIQHEYDQSVDTHATKERHKEDTEESEKLEWYIDRTRALCWEHAALKIVYSQLKEHNSEANRKINVLKHQLHQDELRTWFSSCPGCGGTDLQPVLIVRHRQSRQCLSERGFKVLYAWTILNQTCDVNAHVAERLLSSLIRHLHVKHGIEAFHCQFKSCKKILQEWSECNKHVLNVLAEGDREA